MAEGHKLTNGKNTEYHQFSPSTLLDVQRTALGECVQRTRSQPYFLLFTYLLGLGAHAQTNTHTDITQVTHVSAFMHLTTACIVAHSVGNQITPRRWSRN